MNNWVSFIYFRSQGQSCKYSKLEKMPAPAWKICLLWTQEDVTICHGITCRVWPSEWKKFILFLSAKKFFGCAYGHDFLLRPIWYLKSRAMHTVHAKNCTQPHYIFISQEKPIFWTEKWSRFFCFEALILLNKEKSGHDFFYSCRSMMFPVYIWVRYNAAQWSTSL